MSKELLFSIFIANYNNGKYLQECLESVLAQTYKNWEIILVDDYSTDNSEEIYSQYAANEQVKIFTNTKNEGCGYTKRKCAELANGELCAFLDPDDCIAPNAVEIMVKEHLENPECSIVHSNHYVCDDQLNIKFNRTPVPTHMTFPFDDTIEGISAFASYKNHLYKKTEGINANLKRAIDKDLYYKLEEVGSLKHVNESLYYYRFHSNGISTNTNVVKADYWSWVAKIKMAERRGINLEEYYEFRMNKKIDMGKRQVMNTRNYKLGKSILEPLRKIYHLFKL